ncbi:MAG TPA: carboxy terminal-processing peptidase [Chthoniobacterales bacterium]|jgi:carboxyl-terminal processing protease|nr:carboxy terminal-processing peptidase [Chthoniobacterales bacterium]
MKPLRRSLFILPVAVLAVTLASGPVVSAKSDAGNVTTSVGRLLEEGHYTHQSLNDDVSKKFLKTYLELLDFSHLFFTQQDVDMLTSKYATALDDDVLLGNLKPAHEIYELYLKRVDERVAKIKELLNNPPDYKNDGTIEVSRQKAPWPKDGAEADEVWRGRIASELLQEHLSEHPIEPGPKLIARRYERLARTVHEQDREEQVKLFLDALAQSYDPHSEYLSKADLKNFSINMGLSLVGIGAMLRTEDGYAKIESLVAGGPAQTDGRLKVGDRISAVAQGNTEFVDVRDMRLDKVVEQIRGKKGTHVRLLVIPADSPDPSKRKTVELVRDEIKLKDQEARADVIIKKNDNGDPVKLGWITLPSFYADMDKHQKSTTKDVLMLLKRLKKENISGLVVDLRRNGGGSLEEAIALTGLFLKSGPIVQTKSSNGNIVVSSDPDPGIAYNGPMIVLTSRQSASASEIFAAALQDYGRAVVVGDKNTFGKGTVQTILEIGRFTSLLGSRSQEDGALKLTIQKFYRVAGGSTQLHGVASDIVLPTLSDLPEFGEGALKNCLPYDEVPKARFTKWAEGRGLFIDELKRRSDVRVQTNPEFKYVMEDMERLRKRLDENRISLNEDTRKTELEQDKLRKETRAAERLARNDEQMQMIRLTLDNVDKPNIQPILFPGKLAANKKNANKVAPEAATDSDSETAGILDDGTKEPAIDPERDETLNILKDLVDLNRAPTTASTTSTPAAN